MLVATDHQSCREGHVVALRSRNLDEEVVLVRLFLYFYSVLVLMCVQCVSVRYSPTSDQSLIFFESLFLPL